MRLTPFVVSLAALGAAGSCPGDRPVVPELRWVAERTVLRAEPMVESGMVAMLRPETPVYIGTCVVGWCGTITGTLRGFAPESALSGTWPGLRPTSTGPASTEPAVSGEQEVWSTGRGYINVDGDWIPCRRPPAAGAGRRGRAPGAATGPTRSAGIGGGRARGTAECPRPFGDRRGESKECGILKEGFQHPAPVTRGRKDLGGVSVLEDVAL